MAVKEKIDIGIEIAKKSNVWSILNSPVNSL